MRLAAAFIGAAIVLAAVYAVSIYPQLDDDEASGIKLASPQGIFAGADGAMLVADAGTGANDGRIVLIDAVSGDRTVLIGNLPSVQASQVLGDLAGPLDVAVGADGMTCLVVGAGGSGLPFATLRCTDDSGESGAPAVLDLGRRGVRSPAALVADGNGGWYVTDAGRDQVVHIAGGGVTVVLDFEAILIEHDDDAINLPATPVGLALSASGRLAVALLGGAVAEVAVEDLPDPDAEAVSVVALRNPVDVVYDGDVLYVLQRGLAPDEGTISAGSVVVAEGLDQPAGFALLPDGRFLVSSGGEGGLTTVEPALERDAPGSGGGDS